MGAMKQLAIEREQERAERALERRRCSHARCRDAVCYEHHDLGGTALLCERHWRELCDLQRGTPEFEAFRRRLGLEAEAVASPISLAV